MSENDKIIEDNLQFLSVSSVMQNWLQANSPRFIEIHRVCTRWTTNVSLGRHARRLKPTPAKA